MKRCRVILTGPGATHLRSNCGGPVKKFLLSTLVFFVLASPLIAQENSTAQKRPLVFTHVTVIDVTGGPVQPDRTVVISDGHIIAIGDSAKTVVPKDSQVVVASGKFLIPGLWDMHVHWYIKEYLPLFVANGVTGIRQMWGNADHYAWRIQIENGSLLGPHMVIASPIIDGPKPYWPGSIAVASEAEGRRAVVQVKQDGADFVKVYSFLPREAYFAIADEAKKQGIPFAGHVPGAVSAEEASRAGQKTFEHLIGVLPACSTLSGELLRAAQADLVEEMASKKPEFWGPHVKQLRQAMLDSYSPDKASALFALLKSNGTWQCPTLTLWRMFAFGDNPAFLNDPRLKYIPRQVKASWDPAMGGERSPEDFAYTKKEFQKNLDVVAAMQKSGVGILAGTDTLNPYCFPGFSLHDELGFLVQAGLTPMEALQTATLNPARFLGKEKEMGTIEVGKIADLVLLGANPLVRIRNTTKIAAVVFEGKLFQRTSLDVMLSNAVALASRKSIAEALAKTISEKDVESAIKQYHELRATHPDAYDLGEDELNGLGYQLLGSKQNQAAIAIFQLNIEAFPASYNAYDSLGEAYMANGDKDLAIKNYKKSLELNPKNTNAVEMLKKLAAE
jgi:imidazolonepropionase-like amidohydrolase